MKHSNEVRTYVIGEHMPLICRLEKELSDLGEDTFKKEFVSLLKKHSKNKIIYKIPREIILDFLLNPQNYKDVVRN